MAVSRYQVLLLSVPLTRYSFPIGFQVFFAVLLIIGILLFPESPRWLIKHNHMEDAKVIMSRLEDAPADSKQIGRAHV